MCRIDKREGTVSFAAIPRVLRELFAKNHGGPSDPRPTSARVNVILRKKESQHQTNTDDELTSKLNASTIFQ